jgi:RsmE family RNA methyltransferase
VESTKSRPKKSSGLQKIANAAAEQSHRNRQPEVVYGGKLSDVLKNEAADFKIVAWEESAKQGEEANLAKTLKQLQPGQKLLAVFGPEGGLSAAEVDQMKGARRRTGWLGTTDSAHGNGTAVSAGCCFLSVGTGSLSALPSIVLQ